MKLKESAISVLPIAVTVLVLGLVVGVFDSALIWKFSIGTFLLIIGMSLFNLGVDGSILESGNLIGAEITKSKKIWVIVLVCFIVGILVTVAEPDLMVLAEQLAAVVNYYVLIACVGLGVGVFMIIAVLRIVFQVPMRYVLTGAYLLVFVLAIFVPKEFMPLSFDSGGVTTGPMTVPFIMALGAGIAASKSGGDNLEDSFGIVALSSIGPIIAVMILGFFANTEALSTVEFATEVAPDGVLASFLFAVPQYLKEVAISLLPVVAFIVVFNFVSLKLPVKKFAKICVGFATVYVGIVLFLIGINVGFAPIGRVLGSSIISKGYSWALIPVAMLIGFFTVIAEPAVHVLTEQIEEISGGAIKRKAIFVALMIGVAGAVGLSMARILANISIWWIIAPGFAIAIVLSYFTPKVFTAIAFDSGGVASGTMTAAFILPFAVGASAANGGNILTEAFGVVAVVAMTPLITIQVLGLISALKTRGQKFVPIAAGDDAVLDFEGSGIPVSTVLDDEIIDFDAPAKPKIVRGVRSAIRSGRELAVKVKTEGEKLLRPKKAADGSATGKPADASKKKGAKKESAVKNTGAKSGKEVKKTSAAKKDPAAAKGEKAVKKTPAAKGDPAPKKSKSASAAEPEESLPQTPPQREMNKQPKTAEDGRFETKTVPPAAGNQPIESVKNKERDQ